MTAAALVLAAGSARRFGGNKLAALYRGEPLLAHAIRTACAAPVGRVIVVCAPDCAIGPWPDVPPVEQVPLVSCDLATSLKAGLAAAGDAQHVFVFLGDMPLVPPGIAALLAAMIGNDYAALPRHAGRPGHPVLLSARAKADAALLAGDAGLGRLIRQRSDVAYLDDAGEGCVIDIDRAEDLALLLSRPDQT